MYSSAHQIIFNRQKTTVRTPPQRANGPRGGRFKGGGTWDHTPQKFSKKILL